MWTDTIRKKSCLRPKEDFRRRSGPEKQGSVLPISVRIPWHKRQAELPLQSIQPHQTKTDCSYIFWSLWHRSHHTSHFFSSFCLSFSIGSKRSPIFSTRASTWSERNFSTSAFFFLKQFSTSFQVTGVETVGSSFARSE